LSFADAITCLPTGLIPWRGKVVEYKTAIFRQINKEKIAAHHDGSAFISIPRSLTTSSTNSAVALTATPASSRKPMSLRTKSGHHVQDELGILPRVTQAQQASSSQTEANALQVRVELQADCFAGIWANHGQQKHDFLDPGDVDQALQTASAIGDDRLQRETQGYVVPDAFTHGTSAQRKRWFLNGFNSGKISDCNTFSANSL